MELLDPTAAVKHFSKHLSATSCNLRQALTSSLRGAMRPVELQWDFQVGSREPDPLAAHIVHVREDCGDGAHIAGRSSSPGSRVKVLDNTLIHPLIRGEGLDGTSTEQILKMNLALTGRHRILSP
ncbi:hypothetical protein ACPOL_1670 [Acidisarcina polymorpha]|uniref:Uncharacterized protein n=1 Tax=Acidisarcina polymorpha TaxID=2211140 RepID=A0A2Z5FX95_9BACT|nr:hypothetical protein ACPOL_1670 [Acidisarcina polymorpha]